MEFACVLSATITNPDVGDMELSDTGLEVVRTNLADEVAQRIRVRLSFFKGEWFLDLNEGVPYYQSVLVHGLKDRVIRAVFDDVISNTIGISQLLSLTYEIDKPTRRLSITFRAKLEDGTTFSSTDYPAFYVVG